VVFGVIRIGTVCEGLLETLTLRLQDDQLIVAAPSQAHALIRWIELHAAIPPKPNEEGVVAFRADSLCEVQERNAVVWENLTPRKFSSGEGGLNWPRSRRLLGKFALREYGGGANRLELHYAVGIE